MNIKKTQFSSYYLNGVAKGCKFCVKGRKLVLFITGICRRNCWYCSLSEKRKNKDALWVNERKCKSVKEMIEEAKESNAHGAGITGGDPLLKLRRTLKFASALKKKFKHFHIHIYLPTKFITKEKLRKLRKVADEVRFHPEFLARKLNKKQLEEDSDKIKIASKFWKKEDIGIELPILPYKKKEIFNFILKIKNYIGFVNLNELEISDTNFNYITKNYKLKKGGYVIAGSKEAGLWILKKLKKEKPKIKLKVHLCTAETKNWFQYKNRLLCHNILPYGEKTSEGTAVYFAIYGKNKIKKSLSLPHLKRCGLCGTSGCSEIKTPNLHPLTKVSGLISDIKNKLAFTDKRKNRIIISEKLVPKLIKKYKIYKVEEYPTYDRVEIEKEEI